MGHRLEQVVRTASALALTLLAVILATFSLAGPALAESDGCYWINAGTLNTGQSNSLGVLVNFTAGDRLTLDFTPGPAATYTAVTLRARGGAPNNLVLASSSMGDPSVHGTTSILLPANVETAEWFLTGSGPRTIMVTCVAAPPPVLTGFSPASGWTTGGTAVSLSGSGFAGATGVSFDGGAATDFVINSDTSITATTPAHVAGVVAVTVTRPDGTWTFPSSFTYETPPQLWINDVSVVEGTSGITSLTFNVSLDQPAGPGGVTFDITTADGTASSIGGDYVSRSLPGQTIPTGGSSYFFTVIVNGDTDFEPNETIFANITNVTGATVADGQGMGTIINDDKAYPLVTLFPSDINPQFGTSVSFTALLTSAASPSGTVTFSDGATTLGTANLVGGMASFATAALAIGPHAIAAEYSGDANNASVASVPLPITVGAITTSVTLSSDRNPTNAGEAVTFTAQLAPAGASGDVVFSIDGVDQPQVTLASDTASFTTSLLAAGDHQIVARYLGDATHAASTSAALTQTVRALGSVVIRQETDGVDAVFGFSSPTPALNLTVPTSNGHGESTPISLPAGSYSVTADDMTGAGFSLTSLFCSDGDSAIDLAGRTANIALDAGEVLVCTFTSLNSREKTTQLIEDFLTTRASLILANQPDTQRRIDRLNGSAASGSNPVSSLMGYLPGIVDGGPLAVSTSLASIDRLAGNEQPSRFDIWFEGTFALFDAKGPNGSFNTASLGADYLVSPDLLIGGFVQMDHLSQSSTLDAATISGTGWLAGPYATARLNDNLYLDLLAAAGTSSNKVSPYGTYEDGFDATRWLLSAALQGQWQWDNWTFSPRARVSYFEETTTAYTDSLGVGIPSVTAGLGQIAIGPAISYRYRTEGNVVIDTGLRFEGVADILNTSTASGFDNLHGRIEGTIDLSLPGGARIGLSTAYDGIGSETRSAASAKAAVRLPMP